MAGEITLGQLLRTPTIVKAISQIRTPGSLFQDFYGLAPGGTAAITRSGSELGWDIFDNVRTLASARARGAAPGTVAPNPVGHVGATALRLYEKIPLEYEKIFRTRPLGSQVGTVNADGQAYISRQIRYLAQRFKNAREFCVSRMFRGGFGILVSGDEHILVEKGAGTVDVDYQIPSEHISDAIPGCDLTGAGDRITAVWSAAGTDVIGQLLNINADFENLHGYPLRHIWMGSTVFGWLLNNTGLQATGGTAFRVFDSVTQREINTFDGGTRPSGYEVVFRALPWFRFHVYDAVLTVNGTTTKFIPDTVDAAYVIMTPDPGDWCGLVNGSELIRKKVNAQAEEAFGFTTWTMPCVDPAGEELRALDNFLPALFIPKCVVYARVDA